MISMAEEDEEELYRSQREESAWKVLWFIWLAKGSWHKGWFRAKCEYTSRLWDIKMSETVHRVRGAELVRDIQVLAMMAGGSYVLATIAIVKWRHSYQTSMDVGILFIIFGVVVGIIRLLNRRVK